MSAFSGANIDYPIYVIRFNATEFIDGDYMFYIVNSTLNAPNPPIGSAYPALTGVLTEGSFEAGLMAAVKTYIESRPGGSILDMTLFQETGSNAEPS